MRNTKGPETYVWATPVLKHIESILVSMDVLLHGDDLPKPLVEDIGSELTLGDAEGVFYPGILVHQSCSILQGLDPPFEPAHGCVLASEPH